MEGIEFVLLPGLPHDCVTFNPRDQLIHDNHPPSYNRNLPWIYVADFWLHSLHKHLTAATAPILFSLINRSSAALSCRTNNSPRSSGDISSAQGAFSPSLLSRRTTTLGGDGDPEIIASFRPQQKEPPPILERNRGFGKRKMPSRLATPVLTVDTEKIHKVDTANAQSLHGMWMGKFL